jgi:putative lipoprotein
MADAPADGPYGNWRVETVAGRAVSADAKLSIEIGADGVVSGSGGCNRFHGSAKIAEGGALSFGPTASTRMMCEPEVSELEAGFFKSLEGVRGWRRDAAGLVLLDAAGDPVLRLAASP